MNLTKTHPIFSFDEIYALKMLPGVEASIKYDIHEGCVFDAGLMTALDEVQREYIIGAIAAFGVPRVEIYGTLHGKKRLFYIHDVKFLNDWLAVPHAKNVASYLKIRFVRHKKMKPSMTKIRKYSPVELRPFDEFVMEDGERLVARYEKESKRG